MDHSNYWRQFVALARNQSRILAFLLASRGEISGIEIADAVPQIDRSSVYAAVAALQRDGLIDARWDLDGSHPRRLLRINARGRQALAVEHRTDAAIARGAAGLA